MNESEPKAVVEHSVEAAVQPSGEANERHWHYEVLCGKWREQETGEYGFPAKNDWYVDAGEWRIW